MSSHPTFTVILPVYNGAAYLRQAIDSVVDQTLKDFELLICDDGSTDGSLDIVRSYQDTRIQLVPKGNESDSLFCNLNTMVRKARSENLHFLCQDDLLEPECLEMEALFLKEHPNVAMAYCASKTINAESTITSTGSVSDLPTELSATLSTQHLFFHGCLPGNLSTVCAKAESFKHYGGFNPRFSVSGDYELWSRFTTDSPMGVIPKHLVKIRRHNRQLSAARASVSKFIVENREIRKTLYRRLPPSIRLRAWFYQHYYLASEFHSFFSALRFQHFELAWKIAAVLNPLRLSVGFLFWLFTLNNRYFRVRAAFDLTQEDKKAHSLLYADKTA